MSIKGRPQVWFQHALESGDLTAALGEAHEMWDASGRRVGLSIADSLSLVLLMAREGHPKFERAALKWLRRFSAEQTPTLADLAVLVEALAIVREQPEEALAALRDVCEAHGLAGVIGLRG